MSLHVLGERFVEVDGRQARYVAAGHGDPIVLLHGLPACVLDWRTLRGPLSRLGHVLAVDLPGFGLTDPPPDGDLGAVAFARFVVRFLDAVGETRPAMVVGHSNGGAVAQVLAVEHPARVRRLVLLGSVGWPAPVAAMSLLRSRAIRTAILGAYRAAPRALLRTVLRQVLHRNYADPTQIDDEMIRWAEALIADRPALERVLQAAAAMDPALHRRVAPRIQVPTLLVHGARDRMVPPAVADNLRRAIPGARLVLLRGGSHMIHVERAAEIAALVEEFAGAAPATATAGEKQGLGAGG
ncbi:MAG TPA: alpha/beta fold hydrolase [Myxococcota bacterium]|jgi:pimeloyl-ACP methyl ester carboxylesterase|nr:alpha/beta fold hydrolase [Myxococcota bacterium]